MTDQRSSIVAAIIVHDGKTLLVRRRIAEGSLSWQFPAGEQEPGETPQQTAEREVLEEVGLTVETAGLIGERVHPVTGRHMIYVGCHAQTDDASVIDTEELADLAWCDRVRLSETIPTGLFAPVAQYVDSLLA